MNKESIQLLEEQWKNICAGFSSEDLIHTLQFVQDNAEVLVSEFYRHMMLEKHALEYLSDDMVNGRLQKSLHQWLIESFEVPFKQNYQAMVQKQLTVGNVHARIGIPSWLIMRGMMEIEKKVFELLPLQGLAYSYRLLTYIIQVLSFSSEIMCRSYEANLEINNDMKHTYRLFSAMQDVSTQKEKQRGSLLDWENELMFKVFSQNPKFNHINLSKSEFGLWFVVCA